MSTTTISFVHRISTFLPLRNSFIFTLALMFLFSTTTSFRQSCNSKLSVEKNHYSKTIGEDGATFTMILKNKESNTTSFKLSSFRPGNSCGISSNQNTDSDMEFVIAILDMDGSPLANNEVILEPGEKGKFKVEIFSLPGAPIGERTCVEIRANSDECNNNTIKTLLKVLVPDPSQG